MAFGHLAKATRLGRGEATGGSDPRDDRIQLLEAVIENFPGGISLFDSTLTMVLCNERQRQLLDYPDHLFANGFPTMEQLFRFNAQRGEYGAGDIEEHVSRRMALLRERKPHVYERTRPNGTVLEVRGMPIAGGGFVTTYTDVTSERKNEALIEHLAHHDALTSLPNRALFSNRLQAAIAPTTPGGLVAVHYLDLDRFKQVNDSLGHRAGDSLLVAIGDRLKATVREHDTIARLGGDEFAIIQTGLNEPSIAAVLARRVIRRMSTHFEVAGKQVQISASVGIAIAPEDGTVLDEILAKAAAALDRSKAKGSGCFSFSEATERAMAASAAAVEIAEA